MALDYVSSPFSSRCNKARCVIIRSLSLACLVVLLISNSSSMAKDDDPQAVASSKAEEEIVQDPSIGPSSQSATEPLILFKVARDYDFTRSTEDNYADAAAPIDGKHFSLRAQLDYRHHAHYSVRRQLLHDDIIDAFDRSKYTSSSGSQGSHAPQWLVFTAGIMGSGKSYTLDYLDGIAVLPLQSFTHVDPDAIRASLPEYQAYIARNIETAGHLTQREVGYISEVMVLNALDNGGSVVFDGSLRDEQWYRSYVNQLRNRYPNIKIAILHITAPLDVCIERMYRRAAATGRLVPEQFMRQMYGQVIESVEAMKPYVDFYMDIDNSVDQRPPELITSSLGEDPHLDSLRNIWFDVHVGNMPS